MTKIVIDQPLETYVVRLGDDALVLGHRLSEWCSNAPFLEEDLALSNVALDYIGRARMLYSYAGELRADGTREDDYAYWRDARQYSNLLICELPRGDFAFSMAYLTSARLHRGPVRIATAMACLTCVRSA